MSNHTPGPWFLDGEYVNGCGVGDSAGHSIFYACCCGGVRAETMEERLANAQLIVAAPEMLELLQIIHQFAKQQDGGATAKELSAAVDTIGKRAGNLIAKIEGGGE